MIWISEEISLWSKDYLVSKKIYLYLESWRKILQQLWNTSRLSAHIQGFDLEISPSYKGMLFVQTNLTQRWERRTHFCLYSLSSHRPTLSAHHRVTSRVTTAIDGEALTQEAIAAKLSSGNNSYVTNGMSLAKGITRGGKTHLNCPT